MFVPITHLGEILGMIECKAVGYKQLIKYFIFLPNELLAKLKLALPIVLHDKTLLNVGFDLASGHTDWVSYLIQWNCGIIVDLDKKYLLRYKPKFVSSVALIQNTYQHANIVLILFIIVFKCL